MSGPLFFQTAAGRKFFERDVVQTRDSLERIATALEEQNELRKKDIELRREGK